MEEYSSPLLHPPPTRTTKSSDHAETPPILRPSLDHAIEQCIGSIGTAQLVQVFVVSLAWLFDAQQTFISVFVDRSPNWHCTHTGDAQCSAAKTFCGIPQGSWSWDEEPHVSTVSEWELECYGGGSVAGFPASAFFAGCLVGGLVLATLGDSTLGRKKMLCSTSLAMSAIGILTAFSPNVWVYTFLRFLTGFARATIGTSALVLATEIIGSKWRGQVGLMGFFLFTFGFISLPAIAYATEGSSWRALYMWTSLPAFCYSIIIFFLVHESPRWLLVRGRREEAIQTLKTMASSNGHSLTMSFFDLVISDEVADCGSTGAVVVGLYSALKVLVQSRWASQRLAAVMTVGFGVGLLYYGLPLSVGNLDFNLYLIVTLNAISELPSLLVTLLYVDRLKRRSSMLLLTTTSGAASLACVFVSNSVVQMVIEVSAFLGTVTAFNLMLIYTLELFPTCVRNSAVAMVRQAQVLGGVFSPMLVAAGRTGGVFWSFGVFGVVIGFCGLFVVCLPETRGSDISDTMEEQSALSRSVVS